MREARCREDFEPFRSECPNCGRIFKSTFGLSTHYGQSGRRGSKSACIGAPVPGIPFELTSFGTWRPLMDVGDAAALVTDFHRKGKRITT